MVKAFEFWVPPKSNMIWETYHTKTRLTSTSRNMFANSIAYDAAHTTKGLIKINEKTKKLVDSNRKPCKKNKILTKRSGKKSIVLWKPVIDKLCTITKWNSTNEKKKFTKYLKQPLTKGNSDNKENITSSS